jgi:hypothetical protein
MPHLPFTPGKLRKSSGKFDLSFKGAMYLASRLARLADTYILFPHASPPNYDFRAIRETGWEEMALTPFPCLRQPTCNVRMRRI